MWKQHSTNITVNAKVVTGHEMCSVVLSKKMQILIVSWTRIKKK